MVRTYLQLALTASLLGGCALFGGTPAGNGAPDEGRAAAVLELDPQPPLHYRCGELAVSVRSFGELSTLSTGERTFTLRPVRTASGAKLVAVDDETTSFWSKGDAAMLELAGVAQPECRLIADKPLFRAVGNEPGWRLDVIEAGLDVRMDHGATHVFAPGPLVIDAAGARSYQAMSAGGELGVLVFDRVCVDSMSAMPHPNTVEVRWQDRVLRGCGGEPASLLVGGTWRVLDIDGRSTGDPQRVTLDFAEDGRVAGLAACNRYTGAYVLSGEGLRLGPFAGTRMACPPAVMDEEMRFHAAIGRVTRFGVDEQGGLLLYAGDDVVMRATRD